MGRAIKPQGANSTKPNIRYKLVNSNFHFFY
jgi:hypothetical protein